MTTTELTQSQINIQFAPTRLERILGSNYKWWYLFQYFFKLRTTYRVDNFLFALGGILILFGTVFTWFFASGGVVDDPFRSQLTYYIIGTIVYVIVNTWPSFYGFEIKRGLHSALMLTPVGYFQYLYVRYAGIGFFQNMNTLLIILIFSPLWLRLINMPPHPLQSIGLLIILIPMMAAIMFFSEVVVGLLAFYITEINGLTLNFGYLSNILSGKLFPLGLLIPIFTVNLLNPYSFLFYQPMQIYLNNYSWSQTLAVFVAAAGWCVGLYFFAHLMLRNGIKRNESIGL